MKRLFASALPLMVAGLVACLGSTDNGLDRLSTTINQVTEQDVSSTFEPISRPTKTSKVLPNMSRSSKKSNKIQQFNSAPDLDLFQLTKQLLSAGDYTPKIVSSGPSTFSIGQKESFWLMDLSKNKYYKSDFTLTLITPNAYWYVENNLNVRMAGLERSADRFERDIYPTLTRIFETGVSPGFNNNGRVNILNAKLTDVAGYFSSADKYPISIRPRSNQREIIYINAKALSPGTRNYDLVLSHELQHVIHWHADPSEDTWVNEGLSELASSITLGSTYSIIEFIRAGPVSLIHWPTSADNSIANYGAASLFMHFLTEHYGDRNNLKALLDQPGDNIRGIDQYLEESGYEVGFEDVFRQWAAANILDDNIQNNRDLLGYDGLEVQIKVSEEIKGLKNNRSQIPQYAVEYTELLDIPGTSLLSFHGNTDVELLSLDVGPSGCWWSNSGDSIDSTLSHLIKIPVNSIAVLKYQIWFDIEEYWDYLYIEVSVDNGEHWQIIETPKTSNSNPIGNAFGAGYTGKSGGWLTDSLELTPFAGKDLWVRFQYVTDDAVSAPGACLRNLSVSPETGISISDENWEAQGFVFTKNAVRQDFQVQLITIGDQAHVRQLNLDTENSGEWTIHPPLDGERMIVAVGSLAEKTRELAKYSLSLTPTR